MISYAAGVFCAFSLTALFISGAALATVYATVPKQNFDAAYFTKAQQLNSNLSKGIAVMKEARPKEIDTGKVLQTFATAKPADIFLTEITVQPEKYVIKGTAPSQDAVSQYSAKLDFGRMRNVVITSVTAENNLSSFTIEVKEKAAVKAKAAKGGKK